MGSSRRVGRSSSDTVSEGLGSDPQLQPMAPRMTVWLAVQSSVVEDPGGHGGQDGGYSVCLPRGSGVGNSRATAAITDRTGPGEGGLFVVRG
jgi:hypothetical protein